MSVQLQVVGADAVMLYFAERMEPAVSARIQAAVAIVESTLGDVLIDMVPSYTSVLVIFDPLASSHVAVLRKLRRALINLEQSAAHSGREVTLPVYYSQESGKDLQAVARASALSTEEVIALHSERAYRVYAIGFAPGFAYLGEVDERIAKPRLDTPRASVPRGSVAIAERQTAVYPAVSPGGWNLVGLCPTPMFSPAAEPPMPVEVGDTVRFRPVDRQEFLHLGGELP